MALDPKNPLSMIGASNDPSLTQRTVDQNKGAIDLQNALGKLASMGINERQLAGINNASVERRTGMPLGLDPGNANFQAGLNRIANDASNKSQADAFSSEAAAAAALADSTGFRVNPQATAGQTASRKNSGTQGLPGKILAAASTGSDAAKTSASQEQGTKDKNFIAPGNVVIGGTMRETTNNNTIKGEVKSNDPSQAQRVIDTVTKDTLLRETQTAPATKNLGIIDVVYIGNELVGKDANGAEYTLSRR
jgi:hypothetical protein